MLSKEYQIIETLHENATTVVYRARRISEQTNVIIKMLKPSEMREYRMLQMLNEQKLLTHLHSPYLSTLLEVVSSVGEYAHVFKDIGGTSLYDLLLTRTFTIDESLYISLGIAEAIGYLHQKNIIHADINPKNIIYNPVSKEVKLIDFGYSFVDNRFKYNNDVHAGTSGNLMYMSPEQTGRTRQKIDFRSDLYSFGMTLYHLFSGESPYRTEDRYELIHKQIALKLPNLADKIDGFPSVIADIVQKLIEKNPSLRYQHDEALIFDLKKALKSLQKGGRIEKFEIATLDRPAFLSLGEMYGRDGEMDKLNTLREQFSRPAQIAIAISGTGGIGKTRLIQNFLNTMERETLIIIQGKFQQNKSIHAYATLRDILMQLKGHFSEEKALLKIAKISPHSLNVLAAFFPVFHEIGLKISPLQQLNDGYQQLPYAFSELFRAIVSENRPLVIVLDDIHWIDKGSSELILKSIIEENLSYVHLILMYRDKEMEKNRYAHQLLNELASREEERFVSLALEPLTLHDYERMFQEWFSDHGKSAFDICPLVYKKTLGNPFYLKLLLENFFDSGVIAFEQGIWRADSEQIRRSSAFEDRNELIRMRLEWLDPKTRDALSILSILGNGTELEIATGVLKSMRYRLDVIDRLDKQGLIDISRHKIYFVHDLLLEYVYTSIPTEKKINFQNRLGGYLYRLYRSGHYHDIVQLTHLLNQSYRSESRWALLANLNIEALGVMMHTHEYAYAYHRLSWLEESGIDGRLRQSKRNAFSYGVLRVKILYLNAFHEQALEEINILMTKTHNIEEDIVCFRLLKDLNVTRGDGFERVAAFGEHILKRLGLSMNRQALLKTLEILNTQIAAHPTTQHVQTLASLPTMHNSTKQQIVAMLVEYWESVYYLADLSRMEWATLSIVDLSLKYGNTSGSAFGYVLYGAGLVSQHRYVEAYRFGNAALKINHRFADEIMLPKVHNFMANFISPYAKGISSNISLYQKSLLQSKINGDIVFGTWANFLLHLSRFFAGESLDLLRENMDEERGWILHSNDQKMIAIYNHLYRCVAKYQQSQSPVEFDEVSALSLWEAEQFYPGLAWYAIIKAQEYWLNGDFDSALEVLQHYVRIESNEVIMFPKRYLHTYRCLILLGKNGPLSSDELSLLERDMSECDAYAKASPQKYKFWKLLIRAKSAREAKNFWDVAKYFDDAINEARKQNNPMHIAIAAMCTARFWQTKNYEDMSRHYLSEASIGFSHWGAYALSLTIRPTFNLSANHESIEHSSSSSLLRSEPANFRALLKSFYLLSQSIGKNELLKNLMQIILQNATASKAVLVLLEGDQYYVKASMRFQDGVIHLHHQRLAESILIPFHVIRHAIEVEHKVIVNDPAENGKFQYDPYFQAHSIASCSAFSASIEGEVRTIIYLENEEVFTPLSDDTIQTLRLLLTQAGIIYKNSSLYEMLQSNETNLNKAQQIAHVGSYQYNMTTDTLVWSAETYRIFELEPFSIDITQDWVMSHVHPDDLSKVLDEKEKILGGQPHSDMNNRIITAKGNIRSVYQRAEIYWEEEELKISGTIQDITESQHTEAKIKMLSSVVSQTPFSVILTDSKGKIEYANNQALAMTGYFLHELIGKKMSLFNAGTHSADFYTQLWETISLKRQSWRGTIVNRMKNGTLIDCDSTIFPIIGSHGEISNFVTIQDDVTESNLKDRLFLMQTRQAQMGEMLSMIAHQWRQPLAIMSALIARQKLNILLEKASFDEIGKNFNEMEVQIQHLSRTITDFKDFFKPDKQTSITTATKIVEKALELIEHSIMTRGITIDKDFRQNIEFRTYESELIQVVLNILKNAIDAFDETSKQRPKITLTTSNEGGNAVILIEDNAGGISQEVLETLFSPYVSTKSENGTGLGLYMSKIILEEHCHGQIKAENTSKGANFTLSFPFNHLE
ncbi:MAG: protein kinase [Sulfuricurvum sp.]|nr:protein kinase [Sulfuricurvum sp.]